MTSRKSIFAFLSTSLLIWLLVNNFIPKLITINFIESKFIYLIIKNFVFILLVTLSAIFFLKQMVTRKVVVWLLVPIVIFPLLFSVLTFHLFINASATTLSELLAASTIEFCMYWLVACGIFELIRRLRSTNSISI